VALQVLSPMPGRVANLSEVPDPMFAEAMLGPGLAIDPPRSRVVAVAPVSGTLASLFPHAMGIEAEGGYSILVHLGLETVQLNGEGFTLLKAKGDSVVAGEPIIEWDPAVIEAGGLPVITPLIAIQAEAGAITQLVADGTQVEAGTPVFEVA
jgi:PTS system glucose-specific IIA component